MQERPGGIEENDFYLFQGIHAIADRAAIKSDFYI
jgi:hypothetical protein